MTTVGRSEEQDMQQEPPLFDLVAESRRRTLEWFPWIDFNTASLEFSRRIEPIRRSSGFTTPLTEERTLPELVEIAAQSKSGWLYDCLSRLSPGERREILSTPIPAPVPTTGGRIESIDDLLKVLDELGKAWTGSPNDAEASLTTFAELARIWPEAFWDDETGDVRPAACLPMSGLTLPGIAKAKRFRFFQKQLAQAYHLWGVLFEVRWQGIGKQTENPIWLLSSKDKPDYAVLAVAIELAKAATPLAKFFTDSSKAPLHPTEKRLVAKLAWHCFSRNELAAALELSVRSVDVNIAKLRRRGLRILNEDKVGYWLEDFPPNGLDDLLSEARTQR